MVNSNYKDLTGKIVLGTCQFGYDYGITNISGKPTQKEIFSILSLAWEKGIRRFDTAPAYGSEKILGEFLSTQGLKEEAEVLTKIPSLVGSSDYRKVIRTTIETSLNHLGCSVEVLFFHNAADSLLVKKDRKFFQNLLNEYPVSNLGVSVYEPMEVEKLSGCMFQLAFQFPFNLLDRRFENISMGKGKRYARSVFLQGLLASSNSLRPEAPKGLLDFQKKYHNKVDDLQLSPVGIAMSFVGTSDAIDYFLIGVDSEKHLEEILELELYDQKDIAILKTLMEKTDKKWLYPRIWS